MVRLVVRAMVAAVPTVAIAVGLLPAPALAAGKCTPLTIGMQASMNPIAMAYAPDQFAVRPAAINNPTPTPSSSPQAPASDHPPAVLKASHTSSLWWAGTAVLAVLIVGVGSASIWRRRGRST